MEEALLRTIAELEQVVRRRTGHDDESARRAQLAAAKDELKRVREGGL